MILAFMPEVRRFLRSLHFCFTENTGFQNRTKQKFKEEPVYIILIFICQMLGFSVILYEFSLKF